MTKVNRKANTDPESMAFGRATVPPTTSLVFYNLGL